MRNILIQLSSYWNHLISRPAVSVDAFDSYFSRSLVSVPSKRVVVCLHKWVSREPSPARPVFIWVITMPGTEFIRKSRREIKSQWPEWGSAPPGVPRLVDKWPRVLPGEYFASFRHILQQKRSGNVLEYLPVMSLCARAALQLHYLQHRASDTAAPAAETISSLLSVTTPLPSR